MLYREALTSGQKVWKAVIKKEVYMWPADISTRAKIMISFVTPLLAIALINHSSLPFRCLSASPANAAIYLLTLCGARESLLMLNRFIRWWRIGSAPRQEEVQRTARGSGERALAEHEEKQP